MISHSDRPVEDDVVPAAVERIADWIRAAEAVVVLTGAGVSTASGIPDYRGPDGVWTRDPEAERLSSIDQYLADADVRAASWRRRLKSPAWQAEPSGAHVGLARLAAAGHLDLLVTQNVDGLHQIAGVAAERVVEVHGSIRDTTCLSCGWTAPTPAVLERVEAGEDDPPCPECGGILKTATVSFGQPLVQEDLRRAVAAAERADVFLAVGTSLTVYPVAHLPVVAADAGARLAILNAQSTPLDARADVVLRDRVEDLLPRIADAAGA